MQAAIILAVMLVAVGLVLLTRAVSERPVACARCGGLTELVNQDLECLDTGWVVDRRQFVCPNCHTATRRKSLIAAHDLHNSF
jgi:hypothetical protein